MEPSSTATSDDTPPLSREAQIIQQVEFYFADDNLCQDPHLLALFQEGNGSVSLSDICSFRKMRKFKPQTAVAEALRQSTQVLVSTDGTRLKRKFPLEKRMLVKPKINPDRKRTVIPHDKPWLTKGMLKPTGFEDYSTDGPIKPTEYEEDCRDYDPENGFPSRIETAIMRFCARRTMRQETLSIFSKYMFFGGMDDNRRQFTGGLEKKDMEDLTKREIAELTSYYGVSERVMDGLYDAEDGGPVTWYVDFEKTAKAFLSSHFLSTFDWYDKTQVSRATNVLRNFYNYLLLHDVCPEYRDNLMAARRVCDVAEQEIPKLKKVDMRLPGGFNVACSTLFKGSYVNIYANWNDWTGADDSLGWSQKDAELVFKAGLFAHGTDEQVQRYEEGLKNGTTCKIVSSEALGLEICSIKYPDSAAKAIYDSTAFKDTIINPMGKLKCKRWIVPYAPPCDLPKAVEAARKKVREFDILVDEQTLQFCVPGMKIECCVKTLDLGIQWIDRVDAVYATFFTWLANERIREWTVPGPPKGWMKRQTRKREGLGDEEEDGCDGDGNDMMNDEAELPD